MLPIPLANANSEIISGGSAGSSAMRKRKSSPRRMLVREGRNLRRKLRMTDLK